MNLNQQIEYVKEEIKRKRDTLPKLVDKGKITSDKAIVEISSLEAVYETLTQLRGITRL